MTAPLLDDKEAHAASYIVVQVLPQFVFTYEVEPIATVFIVPAIVS